MKHPLYFSFANSVLTLSTRVSVRSAGQELGPSGWPPTGAARGPSSGTVLRMQVPETLQVGQREC